MKYNVVVSPSAARDLVEAYERARAHAPQTAARWFGRFQQAIQNLDQDPDRFPLAPEDGKVTFDLRESLFGRRPSVFRVLFTIDGDLVRVLRVRRAQRRSLSRSELNEGFK